MRYKYSAVFAFLIILTMLSQSISGIAASDNDTVFFFEDFNGYATNATETKVKAENTVPYVKSTGTLDKALEITNGLSKGKVSWAWSGSSDKMVVAFDIKMTTATTCASFGILNSAGAEIPLFSISADGLMKTYDGKEFAGVPLNVTRKVQVCLDSLNGVYSIYLEGRCMISGWRISRDGFVPEGARLTFSPGRRDDGQVYIDNLRAYSGENVRKIFKNSIYNKDTIELIDIPEKVGNTVIADRKFEADTLEAAAGGFYRNDKGNIIELRKEGENRYLYLEKNTDSDMHLDSTFTADCNYIVMQMDIRLKKLGATIYPFIAGDSVTNTSRADHQFATINSAGELKMSNGQLVKKLRVGAWHNIAVAYNMPMRSFTIYVDNEALAENIPLNDEKFKQISFARVWIFGTGDAAFDMDNFRIYESKTPLETFDDTLISVMPDPDRSVKMLTGRTAIDVNSGNAFVGEKLLNIDTPIEKDGDWCVKPETAQMLFGELPKCPDRDENGNVPLIAYAKGKGLDVYNNEKGLLIFSKGPFIADEKLMQEVEGYMFFDRPDAEKIKEDFLAKNTDHPRVIADKADFERVKQNVAADADAAEWHKKVIAKADTYLNTEVDKYELEAGIRLLPVSRSVKAKMEHWGYAYQTTGDKKYVNAAWPVIESVCSFPDWHPAHYIDTAEMMFGVALAYDWMYDAWTDEQKKIMENAILEMGVKCSYLAYYGKLTVGSSTGGGAAANFVRVADNFNVVSNAGTVAAAIAIADKAPDICFDTVSKAIQSLEYTLPKFAPDGGWEEGPNYWNYTLNYLVKCITTLDVALGSDYGLMDYPGLEQTPYYGIYLDAPQGLNSFHDTWPGGHIDTAELSWFAQKLNEPSLFYSRYKSIKDYSLQPTLYDLLWFNKGAKESKPHLELDHRVAGIEMVSFRESWNRSDGLFFSTHGGDTHAYHGHYDGANYVFDIGGERWAAELVPEDYNKQIGTEMFSWYNRRAEGHNMIVINPDMQEDFWVDSWTYLTRYESKPKGGIVVYDTSEGYSRNASSAKRGFMVSDERRSLTIRDEVSLLNNNSTVYWFMHTEADISVQGNKAILSLNGKELQVEFLTNADKMEITAMDASPLPGTWDRENRTKNDGIRKIAVKLTASGDTYIEAKLSLVGEPASASGMVGKPIDEWTLPDGELIERGNSFLSSLSVNDKEIAGFDPNRMEYTLGVLEGQAMPKISAAADSGNVEISTAESTDKVTTVTSYDSSKYYKTVYVIKYKELKIPDDVLGMSRHIVENVTTSSVPEPENAPINILDGDLNTRWSGSGMGEWALLDLGSVKPVDAVSIAFWQGDARKYSFEIQVSEDGAYYETVYRGNSGGVYEGYELFDFERINARYVKFIGNGNTVNIWNNLLEFAVLAEKGAE